MSVQAVLLPLFVQVALFVVGAVVLCAMGLMFAARIILASAR